MQSGSYNLQKQWILLLSAFSLDYPIYSKVSNSRGLDINNREIEIKMSWVKNLEFFLI